MRFKNTPAGAQARSFAFGSFGEPHIVDGLGANQSQVARTQLTAQLQNAALQAAFGLASLLAGSMRLIRPIHLLRLLSTRPPQPVLPVTQAHAKAPRHGSLRLSPMKRHHHCPPIFFREFFILKNVADRPTSDGTSLTNIR